VGSLACGEDDKLFQLSQWVSKSTRGILSNGKVETMQLAKQKITAL
jgi:hypothetical protein